MQQALVLAKRGEYSTHPNPRVGCLIVRDNQIVGEGWHERTGDHHAEIHALRQAKEKAYGATCYVTLEPCAHFGRTPPCVNALIQAKIKKVIIATLDPNPLVQGKGVEALRQHGIEVEIGLGECEAKALNRGFFSRMQRQKPYVRAKMAMSLDGRTAMASKESQWITGESARKDGQHWRALSDAILTTGATVRQDNCRLTVREGEPVSQPLRIIADTKGTVPDTAAIFHQPGRTLVALSKNNIPAVGGRFSYIALPEKEDHIDLEALLTYLAKEEQINEVLVEAGPTFLGGLLKENLVDELLVYLAPKLLGHQAAPLAYLADLIYLRDHIQGELIACDKIGTDCRLILKMNDFGKH